MSEPKFTHAPWKVREFYNEGLFGSTSTTYDIELGTKLILIRKKTTQMSTYGFDKIHNCEMQKTRLTMNTKYTPTITTKTACYEKLS